MSAPTRRRGHVARVETNFDISMKYASQLGLSIMLLDYDGFRVFGFEDIESVLSKPLF